MFLRLGKCIVDDVEVTHSPGPCAPEEQQSLFHAKKYTDERCPKAPEDLSKRVAVGKTKDLELRFLTDPPYPEYCTYTQYNQFANQSTETGNQSFYHKTVKIT